MLVRSYRCSLHASQQSQYPDTATFLSPYEKEIVINMLKEDTQGLATHYEAKFVWQALSDYKPYILSVIHLGLLIPGSAIALFLPTIINTLGKQEWCLPYAGFMLCAGYSAAIFNFCQFLLTLSHVRPLFQAGLSCRTTDNVMMIWHSCIFLWQMQSSRSLRHRGIRCLACWVHYTYYTYKARSRLCRYHYHCSRRIPCRCGFPDLG